MPFRVPAFLARRSRPLSRHIVRVVLGVPSTVFAVSAAFLVPVAAAQNLYWDLNGSTAGAGGGSTPFGLWTDTGATWNISSAGNSATIPWVNNSVAVFSAGANATGAYQVSVTGFPGLTAAGLVFEEGDVTLNGIGTIQLASPLPGVAPALTLSNRPAVIGPSVTLSGVAGMNIGGAGGTLTLHGRTTVLGTTTLDGADLVLGAAERLSDLSPLVVGSGSTFDLANFDETIGGLGGAGKVTLGSGTLTVASVADTTFSGGITGTGGVIKSGGATLTLATGVAWTGGTTITGGTLALGAANLFPDTAALQIGSDGTFAIGAFNDRIGTLTGEGDVLLSGGALELGTTGAFTFDGRFNGVGAVTKRGTGTLSLGGRSNLIGTFNVAAGTVRPTNYYVLSETADLNVAAGATFDLGSATLLIDALTGAGQVTTAAGIGVFGVGGDNSSFTTATTVTGPGVLVKRGFGTMTLTGAFTGTSELIVDSGTLTLGAAERLPDAAKLSVKAGSTLNLGGFTETVGQLDSAGTIALGTGRLVLAGDGDSGHRGTITGTGGITKAGAGRLTLTTPVAATGPTRVLGGVVSLLAGNILPDGATLELSAGAGCEFIGGTADAFVQKLGLVTGAGDLSTGGNLQHQFVLGYGNVSSTFDGRLRGDGYFAKTGSGTLTLGGVSDFTGGLLLDGGAVRLGADERLPAHLREGYALTGTGRLELAGHTQTLGKFAAGSTGPIDLGVGGHLRLDARYTGPTYEHPGAILGTGAVTKIGNETYTLAGPLSFAGPLQVDAGRLRLTRNGTLDSDVTVATGATFDLTGLTMTFDALTGAGAVELGTGQLTLGGGGGDFTFGGALAGAAGARFRKAGLGRFTLGGAGTVSAYFVDAGTFAFGANEVLPDHAVVTLAADTTLDVAGRTETLDRILGPGGVALGGGALTVGAANSSYVLDAAVSGPGAFAKSGSGTLDLKSAVLAADTVAASNGTLRLTADERLPDGATLTLSADATFDLAGNDETLGALTGPGSVLAPPASTLALGGGDRTSTFAGAFGGGGTLRKIGAGDLTFTGKTTGATPLDVQAGRLVLGGNDRFDAATDLTLAAGATVQASAGRTQTFTSLNGAGTVDVGAGATVGTTWGYWAGALAGTGTFEKSGPGAFSFEVAQDFPGTLRAAAGEARLFGAGPWRFGRVVVLSAARLVAFSPDVTLEGPVEHAGVLAGREIALQGDVTGTGIFNCDVTFAGSFSPGATPGAAHQADCRGNVTLAPTNTLRLDLCGRTRGTEFDAIGAVGTVTLGGTLRVALGGGFVPVVGDFFRLVDAGSVDGAFAAYELPDLPPGRAWDPTRLGLDGKLWVVSDFEAWVRGFGLDPATDGAPGANPSGDGVANLLKYLFGGNPLVPQPGLLPAAHVETAPGGGTVLVFGFTSNNRARASLTTVAVEWSADLAAWTPAVPGQGGVALTVTALTPTESFHEYRIPIAGARGFARLRAAL